MLGAGVEAEELAEESGAEESGDSSMSNSCLMVSIFTVDRRVRLTVEDFASGMWTSTLRRFPSATALGVTTVDGRKSSSSSTSTSLFISSFCREMLVLGLEDSELTMLFRADSEGSSAVEGEEAEDEATDRLRFERVDLAGAATVFFLGGIADLWTVCRRDEEWRRRNGQG